MTETLVENSLHVETNELVPGSTVPLSPEQTGSLSEVNFAEIMRQLGVDERVMDAFEAQIFPNIKVGYLPHKKASTYKDVGMNENREPDGRYEIVIGGKTVENHERRLANAGVPRELLQKLALKWVYTHELGHALQSAYGLAYVDEKEDEHRLLWYGLLRYPRPENDLLFVEPDSMRSPNRSDALVIEKESQAEGIALTFIRKALIESGLGSKEVSKILIRLRLARQAEVAQTVGPLLEKTDWNVPMHEVYDGSLSCYHEDDDEDKYRAIAHFGYSTPLIAAEIVRRFNLRKDHDFSLPEESGKIDVIEIADL